MNPIKLVTSAFKTVFMVYALLGGISITYAGDKNCWAEFFSIVTMRAPISGLQAPYNWTIYLMSMAKTGLRVSIALK